MNKKTLNILGIVWLGTQWVLVSFAAGPNELKQVLVSKIESHYKNARIDLYTYPTALKYSGEEMNLIQIDPAGLVTFRLGENEYQAKFHAYMRVPVASKRIFPKTVLTQDFVKIVETDVTNGMARELRGAVLSPDTNFNELEAKQSIIEGQLITLQAVSSVPAIRRGDHVSIILKTGQVELTSPGVAAEEGIFGNSIRVIAASTKKELVGKIRTDGAVEVQL